MANDDDETRGASDLELPAWESSSFARSELFARAAKLAAAGGALGGLGALSNPLSALASQHSAALRQQEIPLLVFTLTPVLLIFAYGFLSERTSIVRVFHSLFAGRYFGTMVHVAAISDHFKNLAEY